jgi:hypothetical protein
MVRTPSPKRKVPPPPARREAEPALPFTGAIGDEPPTVAAPIPPPTAYREALARWPDDWRQRWGTRANELEARGLGWRDAEFEAFLEVWNERRPRRSAVVSDN